MSVLLVGGCLCSRVRFQAAQAPLRTLACHCKFCQRLTGSSFYVESIFPVDAVAFNDAEIHTFEHTSDTSGKTVYVHFCPACGTTLGLTFERWPEIRAVSRSCFDASNAIGIDAHIWTQSAQAGVVLPSGVDCFAQSRYGPTGEGATPARYDEPVMILASGDV